MISIQAPSRKAEEGKDWLSQKTWLHLVTTPSSLGSVKGLQHLLHRSGVVVTPPLVVSLVSAILGGSASVSAIGASYCTLRWSFPPRDSVRPQRAMVLPSEGDLRLFPLAFELRVGLGMGVGNAGWSCPW